MKKYISNISSFAILFATAPSLAFAQPTTLRGLAGTFLRILDGIIAMLFALLVLGLLYGVFLYLANADDAKRREEIRGYLLWGVIGIAVAFSMWGIIQVLCNTLQWCTVGIIRINPPT